MKKRIITMTVLLAVLFSGLLLAGCDNGTSSTPKKEEPVEAQGKLIILQAYGNAGDGSPAGASHSFVELYNVSDQALNLSGISLFYANGTRSLDVTEDEPWKRIALTGSIPAKGSFLVLGAKHADLSDTRYIIPDASGDINNNDLSLSRRAFKVALIAGTEQLTAQNPFTAGSDGKPVIGYIDMVGAANEYLTEDSIFGFETAPARCSASVAVRRTDLFDYDNNSTDFIEARYAATGNGAFTDEILELRKPRNSSAGSWDPFAEPVPPEPTQPGEPDALAGQLLILQAYGTGGSAQAGASNSFVELYNTTAAAIALDGISLYYANGIRGVGVTQDEPWKMISLTGSIPAGGSYLILGPNDGGSGTRYTIPPNSGDINNNAFVLSNRAFKVALLRSNMPLTVPNPFNMDGQKAAGYIDMAGAANDLTASNPDNIFGYETEPSRNSGSEAIRRKDLTDTDNNKADFIAARYASGGFTNEEVEVRKPRNSAAGPWDPFAEPEEPFIPGDVDYSPLILNEVSGEHKYVEIYNSGTEEIPLVGVKLQRNDGASQWIGEADDSIPAGVYRIFLFNSYSPTASAAYTGASTIVDKTTGLETYSEYTGWDVGSGISDQQILKVAIVSPDGTEISAFIRGDNPPPSWGSTTGVTRNQAHSYSRMSDGSWAYAVPTPGAANGAKVNEITGPGYLTETRLDPPVISVPTKDPVSVTPADTVTISATVTTAASAIDAVVIKWTLGGTPQADIAMTPAGGVYSGVIPAQADGAEVTFWVSAVNDSGASNTITQSFTVTAIEVDYSPLILNEVSGNNKYVEIYNSGAVAVPLNGVKLQRNDGPSEGGSEWTGGPADSIPAGAYRLITFNSYALPSGWTGEVVILGAASSGISSGQVLKVALVDPAGDPIAVFIRGNNPLPAWQNTTGVTQDSANSYSRMNDGTWAYAAPTPGAANEAKENEIASPGYLTETRLDPPVISVPARDPVSVTPDDTVTVSATVTATTSTIDTVVLKWTLDGTSQADISMSASGGVYSAVIPAQADGAEVAYWVSASNNDGDTSNTITQSYTVAAVTEDDEDYSPLILNEISGEHKYVEIYNSGTEAIPLNGVKLQRNDGPTGGSEWTGGPADSIPAGAYRIFLFNTFTPTDKNAPSGNANNNATSEIYTGSSSLVDKTTGLNTYAEFTGWGVNSGISDQQILKIAIVDPDGTEVSVFIRGDNPLPAWGNSTGVTRNQAYSYSRMSDGTWAYAVPTPGAENGTMESAIVTPGYIVSGNLEP